MNGGGSPLPAWAGAVLEGRPPAPTVLILGGFLTSPPMYRSLVARLRARGVADVVVGSVWLPDWLLAAGRGLGPIVTRSGRALLEASARSARGSLGAPLLVIGHSAGGVSARLLTAPEPFEGRRTNAAGRIGAIVTLGTPHIVAEDGRFGRRAGAHAAAYANRVVPGDAFTPRVGYRCVSSRYTIGRPDGTPGERWAWRGYRELLGDRAAAPIEGDGLIPIASALLPGVPSRILDGAAHGQRPGRDWYGSERYLDEWWPDALEAWHEALRVRAADAVAGARTTPAGTPVF